MFVTSVREQTERHPDDWYRRHNPHQYAESVTAAAQFVGSNPANMVLVENATNGKKEREREREREREQERERQIEKHLDIYIIQIDR